MSRATTQRAGDGCACAAVLQAFIRCCPETACPPSQNVQPGLLYASALCSFKSKAYGPALALVAEVVERGVREHPELGVGA